MTANPLGRALRLLSEAWDQQRQTAMAQRLEAGSITRLPDLSFAGTQQRANNAQALLQRMDALHLAALPHAVQVALRQARYRLAGAAKEADWYWTVVDPMGIGFFAMFAPAAYCGGFLFDAILQSMQEWTFASAGDLDRYLALVSDFAGVLDQMRERTLGQAQRGMRIPKPQLPAARALLVGFSQRARQALLVHESRIPAHLHFQAFLHELQGRIDGQVTPSFESFSNVLSADYEALAPSDVGMGQYEGGADIYAALVRRHTTTDKRPEEVHRVGLDRMAQVQAEMRQIRADVGLADDPAGYLARAQADPRFSAQTTEGVAAVFQRYIDRLEAVFDRAFHARARAGYGVAPLAESLEASMTFGYYTPPRPGDEVGRFMFNARNLRQQPLMSLASLTYHELVPGHHLHLSSQSESESLLPIGRYAFINAYNEAWAEYSATLAGELGMYEVPEERYGRLIMDAFLTCRLVVDTGMNALGWSLDQARNYMRKFSSVSEAEIQSESLRYACDMPAQALAYKLGDTEMLRLRECMKVKLADRFDLRDFHAAVLSVGALTMPDLEWHLDSTLGATMPAAANATQ